ncbi:MAG: hypothetical protein HZB29_14440 [Nitrospinae bacterium]|nr:hypothetical protein [Nitrospinota bacterium]
MDFWYRVRFPLMALGMLSLLTGLWAGLSRLGLNVPLVNSGMPELHGPLMVCGFLGTVIGLERAVAMGKGWPYAAPLLAGTGTLALLFGAPAGLGRLCIVFAAVILVMVFAAILNRQWAVFNVVMAMGAASWLIGNVSWFFDVPLYRVAPFWAGFLILTIAGERLELSRLSAPPQWARTVFLIIVAVFIAGTVGAAVKDDASFFGFGAMGLAVWLGFFDLAVKTVRMEGLTRFVAACLLSGYFWLGLGGALAIAQGDMLPGGPMYDAILHSIFLGFVFAMIFGHAPLIFPAILRVPVDYSPAFYLHIALLEISLAARVGGDLLFGAQFVKWGGILNAVTILAFLANTALAVMRGRKLQGA